MLAQTERNTLIDRFIEQSLGVGAERRILAADASFRRYERVIFSGKPYVLMDAPPPKEDVRPFVKLTHWLRGENLHAPTLLAEDAENGLLLLEDMGDVSFRKHLIASANDEWPLYKEAIDILLQIRKAQSHPAIAAYDHAAYLRELEVFTDWYLPTIGKEPAKESFMALWTERLKTVPLLSDTVVLRDYHADNLMWLPEAQGHAKVGLLDYQDALIGDAAYDLVSLLEDARRDVAFDTAARALAYYLEHSGENAADFNERYAALGAQRNLKIIGIFNRLNLRDGKPHYLDLLPRVWAHLKRDIRHPALIDVKVWLEAHCPEAV